MFIVIRGKDSAERPFYIKSRRLSVYEDSIATLELSGCWNFNTTAAFGIEQSGFIGLEKNVACFGLYDEVYTRMKQYYGGGPSWSFIIDEGTAVLNAESCNEASGVGKGQYFNFNVAQWPTQAENRVITIACNWANKLLIAQQTIRFVYQAPPSAFITPSVLVIKTGMQKDIPWTIEPNGWCLDEDSEPTLYWEKQTNRGWIWTNDPWTDDPGIYTVRMVYNSANVNVYSAPIFLIITRSDGSFPKEKYATKQMSSLQLPSHIHAIADQAFVATATEQIIIPSGCSTIGVEAFANSPNLKEIRIPASVTQIDKTALDGCGPVFILTDSAQVLEQASKNDFWIPVV